MWLDRANNWYNFCTKYNLKIEKIQTPTSWSFRQDDMKIKGFIEFFEKIC